MPIYNKILKNIHQPENALLLDAIVRVVSPHGEEIAKKFYFEMLSNPDAEHFLNYEDVKKGLISSMTNWIRSIFLYQDSEKQIDEYRHRLLKIGVIHKKIKLPVSFVNYGMYFLKNEISHLLIKSPLDRSNLAMALILANQVLDCALQVINESYENYTVPIN